MAKFYAVGYTNGGANEKRLGPFNNISDAWKSGQVEQGSTRRFSFAGVVDENGQYVSSNSRACNVEPEPRVDGYGQEWYIRLKDGQVWRKRGTKEQMERLGKWLADRIGTQVEFIQPTGLNSRVCNSSNPVVRKAMNACAMG